MTIDKCIDILDDNFTVIDTHGHYTDEEESEALATAVKGLEAWEKVRQEIERKSKSGQWSEAVIYGMQKSLAIINKHMGEINDEQRTDT